MKIKKKKQITTDSRRSKSKMYYFTFQALRTVTSLYRILTDKSLTSYFLIGKLFYLSMSGADGRNALHVVKVL